MLLAAWKRQTGALRPARAHLVSPICKLPAAANGESDCTGVLAWAAAGKPWCATTQLSYSMLHAAHTSTVAEHVYRGSECAAAGRKATAAAAVCRPKASALV